MDCSYIHNPHNLHNPKNPPTHGPAQNDWPLFIQYSNEIADLIKIPGDEGIDACISSVGTIFIEMIMSYGAFQHESKVLRYFS